MNRDPWHYGTWEGARDGRREADLKLSLIDKIRTLEDMEKLAVIIQRQRYQQGLPVDPKILPLIEAAVAEEQAAYGTKDDGAKGHQDHGLETKDH